MSLDVCLTIPDSQPACNRIFIREDGQMVEISRAEWERRFPGREPMMVCEVGTVYDANITHNLNTMAEAAGLYDALWRPEENGITHAAQLIEPLRTGLNLLLINPARFQQYNPPNGWGDYDGLVGFVRRYLDACEQYPTAEVRASR